MSSSERQRQSKRLKTSCASCRARKALFRYRGEVRADRDHTLCFECYRAELNRARAKRLNEPPAQRQIVPPLSHDDGLASRTSSNQQVAHRQRMLDHLRRRAEVAS